MNELIALAFIVMARLSYYDPATCNVAPINCFDPDRWWQMSGGLYDARENYWRALACPAQFPLETKFIISGSRWGLADGEWLCRDAGSAIVIEDDGLVWLDLLTDTPIWADVLPVQVILPGGRFTEAEYRQDASHPDCCFPFRPFASDVVRPGVK